MLNPEKYLNHLNSLGIEFISGVPDSLLKDFCECVSQEYSPDKHIIASNEGAAVGLAIGYHLGTNKVPMIYLQNSGFGNIINPLLSLASKEVYGIPMLILVGWRGEPGIKDEPQHIHQGRVMTELIKSMDLSYFILDKDENSAFAQSEKAIALAKNTNSPVFLLVKKDTFEKKSIEKKSSDGLSREEAIIGITKKLNDDHLIVSTTGMPSRELYEFRKTENLGNHRDFLTVGGMGHASQISLGLARTQKVKQVFCFDGDGAAIMHLGSFAIIGQSDASNLVHILLNNGVHDSVGGQPTVGKKINFCKIASSCGYKSANRIENFESLKDILKSYEEKPGPHFLEVIIKPGNRDDLGRPTSSPQENKVSIMKYIGSKK